jgi:hypothetical protein
MNSQISFYLTLNNLDLCHTEYFEYYDNRLGVMLRIDAS